MVRHTRPAHDAAAPPPEDASPAPPRPRFRAPVLELDPGLKAAYNAVVSSPMDLRTIQSKVTARKYETLAGFGDDVILMLSNALKFNPSPDAPLCVLGFLRFLVLLASPAHPRAPPSRFLLLAATPATTRPAAWRRG